MPNAYTREDLPFDARAVLTKAVMKARELGYSKSGETHFTRGGFRGFTLKFEDEDGTEISVSAARDKFGGGNIGHGSLVGVALRAKNVEDAAKIVKEMTKA